MSDLKYYRLRIPRCVMTYPDLREILASELVYFSLIGINAIADGFFSDSTIRHITFDYKWELDLFTLYWVGKLSTIENFWQDQNISDYLQYSIRKYR